jgi:hypothetical protein
MAGEFISIPAIYPTFALTPNENPLSDGGKWDDYGRPPLMVASDGQSIHGTEEFSVNGSYYTEQVFTGSMIEGYGCAPGAGLGAALESQRIFAIIGSPTSFTGYSSGWGGGIGENYFFRRYDGGAGTFTALPGLVNPSGAPGPDKLGIRITPTAVEQWMQKSTYNGGNWFMVRTVADTTYRGATWFALETEEQGGVNEVGWRCFGAGVPNRTQIYRIIRGKPLVTA